MELNGREVHTYARARKDYFQFSLGYYDRKGTRKFITKMTKIPVKGNKRKAEKLLQQWAGETISVLAKTERITGECEPELLPLSLYMLSWNEKRKDKLSPTTFHNYKKAITGVMKNYFDEHNLTLGNTTPDDIQDYMDYLLDERNNSTTTANHHYRLMSTCFADAVKQRIISNNPMVSVKCPSIARTTMKCYTREQTLELIRLFKGTKYYIPVLISVFYGLRRSEVLGLQWSAIDFENNTISIRAKLYENGGATRDRVELSDQMKTEKSRRTFFLEPCIKEALLEHLQNIEKNRQLYRTSYSISDVDFVCVDELGYVILPHQLTDGFQSKLKHSNLPPIRFHDLRHTCASLLLNVGVNMPELSALLGHSEIRTTERYAHLDKSRTTRVTHLMSDIITPVD